MNVGSEVAEGVLGIDFEYDLDRDVIQIIRGEETFMAPSTDRVIEAGDVLTIRATEASGGRSSTVQALVGSPEHPSPRTSSRTRNRKGR